MVDCGVHTEVPYLHDRSTGRAGRVTAPGGGAAGHTACVRGGGAASCHGLSCQGGPVTWATFGAEVSHAL